MQQIQTLTQLHTFKKFLKEASIIPKHLVKNI